ncbi:MAG: proprotein convertase P-domain-containing protein [Deltaproteobacteria bacterium]|nr:proprotein convertase P-domain-containing protein [Deltaproteobacteria bacterium]
MRLAFLIPLLAGCFSEAGSEDDAAFAAELTAAESARVIALVNYPGVDQAKLRATVGLTTAAAGGIASYRAGHDGVFPSLDDVEIDTLAELDAIPYVGATALAKLNTYAQANPAPAAQSVEGVRFLGWQAEIVVWGVNTVPVGVLNGLLDNRAAANLVAARPFASLTAVGAVPWIGGNALSSMRGQARTWWNARISTTPASLAGTFDGVTFDETTAAKALEIANARTRTEMVAGGVNSNGASAIVGNRPYTTIAAIAAVSGVGTSTMRGLHTYATALLSGGSIADDQPCTSHGVCASGLCSGLTYSAVGWCRATWMAGTFTSTTDAAIPDASPNGISQTLVVSGLATVPEDLIVNLDIDHPRKTDLYIVLTQPSSAESLIWDVDSAGLARVVVGASLERDASVNGTWTLHVSDHFGGSAGTLRGWSLELTSRFD